MTELKIKDVLASMPEGLPRYTSYPPANHFSKNVDMALQNSFCETVETVPEISAYIHIPFCDRLCWFCGCHTKQVARYDPVRNYVASLVQEIGLWVPRLKHKPRLSHMHLGGGSPSLLQAPELEVLKSALKRCFSIDESSGISIEIDPSDVNDGQVENLVAFGMTRASIGVQDFDPLVQAAINRPQSFGITRKVVKALRDAGVRSVNIDALYGLPFQNAERLARTIEQVIELKPDRVALFGYAHVPWLKTHQKLIDDSALPNALERFDHKQIATEQLVASGYVPIGIDHFALPNDSLSIAASEGRLRRNFQGYTDENASVLLGLGPSSIGHFEGGFVQNEIATGQYLKAIAAGQLPLARGIALSLDDKIRGAVIERLMCDFAFSFSDLRQIFGIQVEPLVREAKSLAAGPLRDLCEIADDNFKVKREAWPLVRLVASKFDTWLVAGQQRYSKAV